MSQNYKYIPKKKLKFIIGFKKLLNFIVLLVFFLYLGNNIYDYSKNIKYSDENNIIKYHDFGYVVYNKENKLKEIYFYDSLNTDKDYDIISYIQKNMLLQSNKDFLVKIMKKDNLIENNYINIFGLEKQETLKISGYKIKGLLKTDNEERFVVMYVRFIDENKSNYCFAIDTILINDKKDYCITKNNSNLPMSILGYSDYYFIAIEKQIFVFSKNLNKIISIINSDYPVIGLSSNNEGDIKVKSNNGVKIIRSIIVEYFIIRKLQGDSVDLNKLLLNSL